MIDRSNGRAPKPVSARIARKALLGSTALIGVALATPALAQTANPSGGGSVSGTGTASNGTGLGGGLTYQSTAYNGMVTMSGVTIANTSGNSTDDALALQATNGSLVVNNIGNNNLSTTRSNGAALRLGSANSNISWGVSQGNPSSVLNLTGSYGLYARTTAGFVNIVDFGTTSGINSITANGTAVEGIHVEGSTGANISLRTPAVSGFQIGIRALTGSGTASVSSTGGTITATATGIDADATAGDVTIDEAATIVAPTGIDAEATGNVTVTNRGTIDASGTPGYGIRSIGGGTVSLTVNAAIGGTTPFSYGIWAQAGASSGNAIAVNANVYGTTAGIWTANGSTPFAITVASGRTVTGTAGAAIDDRAGSTITNNGTLLAASGVSSTAVNMWSGGTLTNNGTITSNDGYAFRTFGGVTSLINSGTITGNTANAGAIYLNSSAATTVTLNAGSIVNGRIFAYDSASTGTRTVTVNGVLGGDYNAISGGDTAVDALTLGATGSISGTVWLGGGDDSFTWGGGALGGTLDGGSGTDTLSVALGTASATLSAATVTGFETFNQQSGTLTLTGAWAAPWNMTGGTLNLSGSISEATNSALVLAGTTVANNSGRLSGGSDTILGFGVRAAAGANATVRNTSTGIITAGFGGALLSGANLTIENSGIIRGTDAVSFGIRQTGGALQVTNSGVIVGGTNAFYSSGSGSIALSNSGLIANGSVSDAGAVTFGTTANAIDITSATIFNSGTINGAAGALITGSWLTLVNTGAITGRGTGSGNYYGVATNNADIVNSGAITGNLGTGIYFATGTVTNAATGHIVGSAGSVQIATSGTFNNYGTAANGITSGPLSSQINLFAGSYTGNIALGSGNDTLSIYTGQSVATAVTRSYTDPVSGAAGSVTLQAAGVYAQAFITGTLNLGGGNDVLQLRGAGTGGLAASLSLATLTGAEVITKLDAGTWTLGGVPVTPGVTINAGNGSPSGILNFTGTSALTGTILVNGATVRALTAGAFGTGTIYMMDPTVQYGATGTYANPIILVSSDPSGDPSRLQADAGVTATLTGLISQSGGTAQPLVFDGAGTIILTNGANDYAGLTTISNGTLVQSNTASALGTGGTLINSGAVLQIDNQTGGILFTEGGTISGAGTLRFTGNTGAATALGAGGNGVTTISMAAGGLVDIQSGSVNGSTSGQGFWTGNLARLNIASGAAFYTVEGVVQVDALTGSGNLYGGFGGTVTMTIGAANGSGTFSGNIANDPTSGGRVLALTKTGTGTQTLTGTNAYTGTTTISGGTLALSGAGTLTASAIVNNATFDISGHTGGVSILNLTGSGATTLGANTLTVSNGNGNGSYSGTISGTGGLVKQGSNSWTLTGTNDYSGGTLISGGTLAATTASLGTGAIVDNSALALSQSFDGTLSNDISGTGGVTVSGAGRITLGGSITSNSVQVSANGRLTIAGTRAALGTGVTVGANANLTVATTGTVRSLGISAVVMGSTGGSLNNAGMVETLSGSTGHAVSIGSGVVTNDLGATIRQQSATGGAGVYAVGTLNITNNGAISSAANGGYDGVTAQGRLTLTNTGTITAANASGVATAGTGSSVTNSGTILGGSDATFGYGAQFATGSSGSLTNQAGGLIAAGTGGVLVQVSGLLIDNSGRIVATGTNSRGVYVQSGVGAVTNQADGTIVGRSWGITIANTGTVTNSGFIGGGTLSGGTSGTFTVNSGGYGIVMNGGSVTNNAGGSIIGGIYGVASGGMTAATIVNSGTITGTTAIFLTNNNADTVTLNAGSVTNGLIQLGGGNDTLNWNGGSFTSIDAGTGTDVFNVNLAGAATLDMANLTGFETYALNGGALTVNGVQGSGGGWAVTNASLTLGATAQSWVTGTGVTLTGASSALTIADGGSLAGYTGNGVAAAGGTSVTNAGLIRSTGASYSGVLASGGTIENQAAGLIAADGNGVTLQTGASTFTNAGIVVGKVNGVVGTGVTQTLVNSGVIVTGDATDATTQLSQISRTGTGDGVRFTAGGSVTNTGFIGGNANGVTLSGGAATLNNSGTIEGGSGWAVAVDAVGSAQLTSSGTITGGTAGAIQLTGSGTATVTLAAGSTTTGNIVSTGSGTRTLDIGGTLNGSYDASGSTGTDIVRLRDGGSLAGANLGDGNDTFVYIGGAISGLVDGGAGEDKLFGDFGAGNSGTVSLANFANFEVFGVLSGNLLLSGPSATPGAAIYAGDGPGTGGTITFDGTTNLTGDIYVNGGTIVANTAGAFGTGTIHLIDPTATFGATGTYANAISLEVATPSSSDPATLNANAGVTATLTGAITTGTGPGVDPAQQLVIGGQGTILLTNTANSWTGTTTINAGATLQGTSATISGGNIVANGTLAYVQPASGTVAVDITGNGRVNVSGLAAGQELTFSGSNSVSSGLYVLDGSVVTNGGTFSNSVFLEAGGAFRNAGTVNGTVSNSGALAATVTNQAGGEINGLFSAVSATGALSLTNEAGATLQGKSAVVANGGANIINAGTISGNLNAGISLGAGGTIVSSGSIQGGSNPNSGWGISSTGALSFTAQTGGTLGGTAGAITSNGATTIDLQTGSTTSGAITITGANASSVTIAGSYTGAVTLGDGDDTLVLDSSASIGAGSTFAGGAGSDGLVLAGSGNASLDLGTLAGFESRTMNGTGVWTLTGTDGATGGWQVNSGTLAASGGSAINDGALVTIAAAGTFQLLANEAIGNLAGSGTVQLDASTLTLTGAGGSFGGVIAGAGNLRIESGAGITLSGANTYTGQTTVVGTLTLGASDVLADASTLVVLAGGTLDLGANSDTIAAVALNGTLNGTGTLTAASYVLDGATVNGNLGTGTVYSSGATMLNGTAAGGVAVNAGTLTLGAADRLADTATVQVDAGATLNLGAFDDTINILALNGTLAGAGTLTAAEYQLAGATVDANLGTGTLFNLAGTSTLNGTAAGDVSVQGGTLALGAANRLEDSAAVAVAAGATLDIGAYNDTVGALGLSGTLAGTGTLTALEYQLTGATVNANLGAGTLFQIGGTSTLNGTAAGNVSVQGGTLALGASNRLADAATVAVAAGATLDIGAYNDTVGALGLNGTLAGSGTLTAGQYQLTGALVNANLGAGTVFNLGGTSTLNGTAAGDVSVQGGTLALGAANRLADTAIVSVSNGATLDLGAYGDTVAGLALNGTLAGTGTLTAAEYALTGATVNANLGAGTLFQVSGASTLNGISAASAVQVQGGTLRLGAANRLADTATVAVAAGATLDLGANSDTVGALGLSGTLAGTGTLTAAQVQLNGATVNANLGTGTLANVGGTSRLTGTSAAGTVLASAGTLRLGASERLANTAILGIESGATFDLAGYTETIGSLSNGANGGGTLALGAGRLVVTGNADAGFSGNVTGSGVFEKQGTGRLTLAGTLAMTGRIDLTAGTLVYSASSQGGMRVQGGTLIGGGSFAGPLTLASGTLSPGGLGIGLLGTTINPIGSFTVGSLAVSGGNLLFDFGGQSLNFASDTVRVTGAATLSGGTVAVNALTSAASDYRFNQLYVLVQANSLTGTFANGTVFDTVASNPNLKWRLRYDLMANAVVLQVQKNMEFTDGVSAGDANTLAVANALSNSTTGNATDEWAATLNSITALGTAQRIQAFRSFSGEALADLSTATIAANNLFTGLLRQRVGDGDDSLVGGGFGDTSLAQVRATSTAGTTFASRLASADAPEGRGGSGGGIWGQAYGGYQHLLGTATQAGFEATTAGVAMGAEVKQDGFTVGVAGGVAQIDGDVNSRNSTLSGTQYQLGGYVSYDSGSAFVSASGSWYSGDFDSKRTLSIGSANSLATGDIHSDGYSFGATAGFRAELGNGLKAAVIASAAQVHDSRDGFTENATGGLGLQMGGASRDLFTATGEVRLGATVKAGSGFAMPWVSMGMRYNAGDLDALGNMRFAGAPTGTGSFIVEGARMAPVLGTLGVGIDARASKNVRLGIALEGAAGKNSREGKASIRVKIGF